MLNSNKQKTTKYIHADVHILIKRSSIKTFHDTQKIQKKTQIQLRRSIALYFGQPSSINQKKCPPNDINWNSSEDHINLKQSARS